MAYGGLALAWWVGWRSYEQLYLVLGLACVALMIAAMAFFPRFEGPVPQKKHIVLERRYWLYYALTFMTGARRQLFFAFGGFLLVKKFGYSVTDMALLMLVTTLLNTVLAPRLGALVMRAGERRTIMLENIVLILVFAGYATTSSWQVAGGLFVIDGIFFTLTLAQRTYFQKIADPADMASTMSVAFTINHIAAVVGAGRLRRARHDRSRHHLLDGGLRGHRVAQPARSWCRAIPHPATRRCWRCPSRCRRNDELSAWANSRRD